MKTLREYIDIVEGKQPVFTPEIMPCAKCGSPAQVYGSNVLDYRGQWRVMCDKNHSMPGENLTQNRAVHKWNNRQKEILASQNVQEEEVDKAYTPSAGELARDLIKMPDSDFNKKYGMSKQQANRYYSSSKLKDPGVAEAQKTDNRPASQFDREIVKAQPDGSCELKCGHKTSAKLSKNPVGKKIFCARCYELRNKKEGVAEGSTVAYEVEWTDKNTGEQGLTTVSALTSQDAADKLVKMKLQQLDNVDVTDVFPAHKQTTDKEQSVDEQATPEAIARIEQLNSK